MIVPLPVGRPPVVVCSTAEGAASLDALGLPVEVVAAHEQGPPPGFAADVLFGGNGSRDWLLAWRRGASWVHLPGAGIDNVPAGLLDGVVVTNAAGVNARQVAEFAMAGVLAFAKRLPEVWGAERVPPGGLDLVHGRRLGVVGFGHVGREVARLGRAFGMEIVCATRTARPDADGVRFVPLAELAATADHVVVAATASAETRRLLGEEFFAAVRPGLHLVNVARGSLVDQEALRAALDDGRVARATLDVTEPEPLPDGHWLRSHPRVLLSPHLAYSAPGHSEASFERFTAELRRYLAGEPLERVVADNRLLAP